MKSLADDKCVPCRGDQPVMTESEIEKLRPELPRWNIVDHDGITKMVRVYKFKNFSQALAFSNKVGVIAEIEQHHPVLETEWGAVTVTWWTHEIGGLHKNDFIMAARTDDQYHNND